jgi:hypothetical protein
MAYKSPLYDLKTAWYSQIKNNVTGPAVYKDAVPLNVNTNYILIRSEGLTQNELNNSAFFTTAIIVVEILTKFANIGNSKPAYDLLNEINFVMLPSPNSTPILIANHQVVQVNVQSETEIYEDDGAEKLFRLIVRYEHILNQN